MSRFAPWSGVPHLKKKGISMWFRNEKGNPDRPCHCGTWQRHWMLFNPGGPSASLFQRECAVDGCHGPFEVGGHVRRIGIRDPNDEVDYVVPMCRACQRSSELTFQLKPGVNPAPSCTDRTCERPH